jgi:hypothetical protein
MQTFKVFFCNFLPCTHTILFYLMDRMKKRQTYEVCR